MRTYQQTVTARIGDGFNIHVEFADGTKGILTSSFGGMDANIGLEVTYKRKTMSWDILRFHQEGFELSKAEFESPLKSWME